MNIVFVHQIHKIIWVSSPCSQVQSSTSQKLQRLELPGPRRAFLPHLGPVRRPGLRVAVETGRSAIGAFQEMGLGVKVQTWSTGAPSQPGALETPWLDLCLLSVCCQVVPSLHVRSSRFFFFFFSGAMSQSYRECLQHMEYLEGSSLGSA